MKSSEVAASLKIYSPFCDLQTNIIIGSVFGGQVKALVGQDAKSGKFTYYVCGTLLKKGAGSCQTHYLNAKKFESLIISKIKEHILTEGNLRELIRLVNEEM